MNVRILARGLAAGLGLALGATTFDVRAEPANATCAHAKALSFPSALDASTAAVTTASAATPCGRDDVYAAWYAFAAPTTGRYLFSTDGSAGLTDTTIAIYDACDAEPSECVDDQPLSLFGAVTADLVAGQSLRLRVAGWGTTRGAFHVVVDTPQDLGRPPNDECAGATPLSVGQPVAASTLDATGTDVTASCGGEDTSDIWYSFRAPATQDYDFFLSENLTSANIVSVHTTCGGPDLSCGLGATTAHVDAGDTVFVRVGTSPEVADTFDVNVGPFPAAPVPPNDTFTNATTISAPASVVGTTVGATGDAIYFGPTCGPFVNAAVWYAFTAPADGSYIFDTNGSEMTDTVLAAFEGCDSAGGALPAFLGCDDDGGTGSHSKLDGYFTAGTELCFAVAGRYLSEHGGYHFNISFAPQPPANATCEGATPLVLGEPMPGDNTAALQTTAPASACVLDDFPLWYSFTAPADGDYKFDTKATTESSWPDLALFAACDAGKALDCSIDPYPVLSRSMKRGEEVFLRASTNVFLRGPIALRAGPTPTPPPTEGTGGGGGGSAGAGGGSSEPPVVIGGCGCAVAPMQGSGVAAVWLALVLTAARRRSVRTRSRLRYP